MNYGDLTIIAEIPRINNQRRVLVKCVCGNRTEVYLHHLKSGKTRSCGNHKLLPNGSYQIINKKEKEPHRQSKSRTYASYAAMKDRCLNPNSDSFQDYAGRGITLDPRWIESFSSFVEDMGIRPENTTLDRIDNNEGYTKSNCRWATDIEQNNNKRTQGLTKLHRIFGQIREEKK
jgi:hypothetical protein